MQYQERLEKKIDAVLEAVNQLNISQAETNKDIYNMQKEDLRLERRIVENGSEVEQVKKCQAVIQATVDRNEEKLKTITKITWVAVAGFVGMAGRWLWQFITGGF